jgi:hypothetical protein
MSISFNVSDHARWVAHQAHQNVTQFIQENSEDSNGVDAQLADLETRLTDLGEAVNSASAAPPSVSLRWLAAYDGMKRELEGIQESFNEIKGQLPVATVQRIETYIRKLGNRLITKISPHVPNPGNSKEITSNDSHTIYIRDPQPPQQGTPMPNDSENIHIHEPAQKNSGNSKEITSNDSHTIYIRDPQSSQQSTPVPNDSEGIHIHEIVKKAMMAKRL